MEEDTEIYISKEETRQKKRETAEWLMEIVRHLLIAAYDIDNDARNRTISSWMTEGLGFTGGPSDDEAMEHIAEAYYRMQCKSRPGSIEDIRDSAYERYSIDAPYNEYDYSFISSYLPDEVRHAIVNNKENKKAAKRNDSHDTSFVGIMELDDGMLAFGDTKGTRLLADGTRQQEAGRAVQKVFRYEDSLLVTHGINEVSFGNGIISMEDYINGCMQRGIPLHHVFEGLKDSTILKQIEEANKGKPDDEKQRAEYWFITGQIINNKLVTDMVIVTRKIVSYIKKEEYEKCINNRIDVYADDFPSFLANLEKDKCTSIDAVIPRLQEWMEKETANADEMLEYHSVGLPLQIETMRI